VNPYVQVALGGAVGSVLRFALSQWITAPWRTFTVNAVGAFAIGVCFALEPERAWLGPLVMVGFLGGFTTFSSFWLDFLKLVQADKIGLAVGYALGSVVVALLCCWLGFAAGNSSGSRPRVQLV
jgi:fluoride exporter